MMCEQSGPKELVSDVRAAESAGFDFAVISDHYFPWLDAMGHSPYAWSVLGAAAYATERIDLMTYVTCPIKRYHPAVVAQKAATVAIMSDGRFTLGLGAGENLNEHVTGGGWPPVNTRHRMLREALEIIKELLQRWLRQLPGRVLRGRLRQAMGSAAEDPAHRGRRFRWSIVPAGRRIRRRHDRGRAQG